MIEFTDNAYAKLVERLSNETTKAIRFGVTGGGCTGHKYIFDICTSIDKTDYCVDFGKFKVYIDRLSSEYAIDTVIDWKTEGLNEEFTYFNPQEASSCGCGESIMFKPRAQENEIRAIQIR